MQSSCILLFYFIIETYLIMLFHLSKTRFYLSPIVIYNEIYFKILQQGLIVIQLFIIITNHLMYRNSPAQQADSMQRDALINTLKKELYTLRDKEHQILALSDELNNNEAKYQMMKDEKERIQNQHRIKLDINRKNMVDLRGQIDNVKMQIYNCSVHIEDILREAGGIKRMVDNRQSQIGSLMAANRDLQAKNERLIQDNKSQLLRNKSVKDQRNRCDNDNQKLHKSLQQSINNLKHLQKEARMLQSSNNKLSAILLTAQKDYVVLIQEMKERDLMVDETSKRLEHLKKQIADLTEKINRHTRDCETSAVEVKKVNEILQVLIIKNKQNTKRLKNLQSQLRAVDNEIDQAVLQRDNIQNNYDSLTTERSLLDSQIDHLLIQIIQYEKLNKELNKQIQHYIQCDIEARNMLDRREKMTEIMTTVASRLNATGQNIKHLRS